MPLVVFQRVAVHDDVVQEDEHELIEVGAEGVVHERHEHAGRIAQAHREHGVLELALARHESSLVPILLCDQDLIEAGAEVDLAEVFGVRELVEQLVRARQRVAVLHRLLVDQAVVGHRAVVARRR